MAEPESTAEEVLHAVEEAVEEDAKTLVTGLIALVSTFVVLMITLSIRMHFKRERQRKPRTKSTKAPPGAVQKSDLARMKQLVQCADLVCSPTELLLGTASTPVVRLLGSAATKSARRADLQKVRKELRRWCPEVTVPGGLEPDVEHGLLLLLLLLNEWRLHDSTMQLSEPTEAAMDEIGAVAVPLLMGAVEGAATLEQSLVAARLVACIRLGLWSWDAPECLSLMNERLDINSAVRPQITASLEARRWMGGELAITPGTTVEVRVRVAREHAGDVAATAETAKLLLPSGASEATAVSESFICLLARDSEGSMGTRGTLIGSVDVDVVDLSAVEASATLKFAAPLQPGEYNLRASLLSLSVLGVETEARCSFTVVADAEEEEEEEDSDYD